LLDVDSGKVIANFNEEQSMIPASVMKILTTGCALAIAGPNYHFITRLQFDGELDAASRTLNGNIYIKGGGDPTLGSTVFGGCSENVVIEKWLQAIQKLRIDTIKGAIIADARLFEYDIIPAGWSWEDMQSDYCAGPSGLSFRENLFDIRVHTIGDSIALHTEPSIPGLKLYSNLVISKSAPSSYCYVAGMPYADERFAFGEINPDSNGFVAKAQMPDPAFTCASSLLEALRRIGIYVRDSATTVRRMKYEGKFRKYKGTTFYSGYSPALIDIINYTNHHSINFYAESILKLLAALQEGYGSTIGGCRVVRQYLKMKGIDVSGLFMCDGSGLSRYNSFTPKMMTETLAMFAKDSVFAFDAFYNSLPVAGESGTMRNLCIGTSAQGNVRAKSGTVGRVKSYAGYVRSKSGKLMAFAMISNNHLIPARSMRSQWEELMELMAELD
ncbi:MAG: D-alanyl-D-alanine carboxypeptidase/D-alanyl-D-alanine-endopeptidase, partial [Flavobacteriales bacterium]